MRVLIAEDEKKTSAYLSKGLTEHGFVVSSATDGDEALSSALASDFDLLVLDIMLPRRDGWSVLRELRKAGKETPVIFLTARDAVHDRVKGLELGADDYLVKPFAFSELLARIRSILRRSDPGPRDSRVAKYRSAESVRIDDLDLDLIRHKAVRGGKRLDLTPKEFALLSLFAPSRRGLIADHDCRAGVGRNL